MNAGTPPPLRVSVSGIPDPPPERRFTEPFRIGRVDECGLCIKHEFVSRGHAEVFFQEGGWAVRDLGSANGVFVNGQRVDKAILITDSAQIRLGVEGPFVAFTVEQPVEKPAPAPVLSPAPPPVGAGEATIIARYFSDLPKDQPVGDRTMMIRQAYSKVQTKQKKKYGGAIAALALLVLAAGAWALYERREASKQKAAASELFYAMKSLDVDIANVAKLVVDSHSSQGIEEIRKLRGRRREMEKNYDRFLTSLHVYDPKMTPQRRLIMRVARIFGECEINMPAGFAEEVETHIKAWQSTGRFRNAIKLAQEKGYTPKIAEEMLAAGLPAQFFYLGMQESDFNQYNSGPMTRKGIAKGMWQFIPETAVKYGLRIGPLADFPRPDPADDRHHYDRATKAAARYLSDLYGTDAQASGLLVMACYNWGEDYVLPLVRKMPPNPKDRNFWQLLSLYRDKVPHETYEYVFYIVSAAVIGEDPRLFGFDFDNPLAHLEVK